MTEVQTTSTLLYDHAEPPFVNPYYDEWAKSQRSGLSRWTNRQLLVQKYAWAIPNERAIQTIVSLSPVIEVGAGTGYWASLVARAGGRITAYDQSPPSLGENEFRHSTTHYTVQPVSWLRWEKTTKSTLMLCWPPMGEMAAEALEKFRGSTLVYIGESAGGCTACDDFFKELDLHWEETKHVRLPQWDGIHDNLTVYRRVR